jgi:hypothetical protein
VPAVLVVELLDEARAAVRRGRLAVFRRVAPAAFLVRLPAARRVVDAARRVVVAARRVVARARDRDPRATCRACLVRLSMRFKTEFTSARVLAFLTWAWSALIAARADLSASLSRRSSWRRRSGGILLSASLSARRPAVTARPTMLVSRRDVRFLFPIITSLKMSSRSA